MKATYSQRLIKLADLNHHQTFFAGRCSEYFLESSYFAVAQYVDTKDTVLLVLHGIDFKFPIFAGDIVTFESKVISVGRSTLTVYTKMYRSREPETEEERFLQQQALEVMEDSKKRAKAMNQRL